MHNWLGVHFNSKKGWDDSIKKLGLFLEKFSQDLHWLGLGERDPQMNAQIDSGHVWSKLDVSWSGGARPAIPDQCLSQKSGSKP